MAAVLACGSRRRPEPRRGGGPLGPAATTRWSDRRHHPNPKRPQAPPRHSHPPLRHPRGAFVNRWFTKAPCPAGDRADRIPVTTVPRTLADLPSTLAPYLVRRAIRQAEFLKLPVGIETDRTRSDLERDFLRLCRRYGLPAPEVNVLIDGMTVDFLWRDALPGRRNRQLRDPRWHDRVRGRSGTRPAAAAARLLGAPLQRTAARARTRGGGRGRRCGAPGGATEPVIWRPSPQAHAAPPATRSPSGRRWRGLSACPRGPRSRFRSASGPRGRS